MNKPNSETYNMDCVQGLKHYPDNHFDLAILLLKMVFVRMEFRIFKKRNRQELEFPSASNNQIKTDLI